MHYRFFKTCNLVIKKFKNKIYEHWGDIIVKFLFTATVFIFGGLLGECLGYETIQIIKLSGSNAHAYYIGLSFFIIIVIAIMFWTAGVMYEARLNRRGIDYESAKREYIYCLYKFKKNQNSKNILFIGRACTDLFDADILKGLLHFRQNEKNAATQIDIYVMNHNNPVIMKDLRKLEVNVVWEKWIEKLNYRRSELLYLIKNEIKSKNITVKMKNDLTEFHNYVDGIIGDFEKIKSCKREEKHKIALTIMENFVKKINSLESTKDLINYIPINNVPTVRIWYFPGIGGICGIYLSEVFHSKFGLEFPSFVYGEHASSDNSRSLPFDDIYKYRDGLLKP